MNNAIVLIDYFNLLVKRGMKVYDAIVEAGKTRLRPVLLTAITTVIGLIPLAMGVSFDFHEFTIQVGSESGLMWRAMAYAVIFGLSFATVLTLIVVPVLIWFNYSLFNITLPSTKNWIQRKIFRKKIPVFQKPV